jgi:hypothetical protein
MALIDPKLIKLHRPKYRISEEELSRRMRLLSNGQYVPLLVEQVFPEDTSGYYFICIDEVQSGNLLALRHLRRKLVNVSTDWNQRDV